MNISLIIKFCNEILNEYGDIEVWGDFSDMRPIHTIQIRKNWNRTGKTVARFTTEQDHDSKYREKMHCLIENCKIDKEKNENK